MSDHTKSSPPATPDLGAPHSLPGWGVALAATGIVLTAHTLGVAWLREPVLGAPAGLWAIGLLVGIFSAPARKRLAALLERAANFVGHSTAATELASETDPGAGWWPRNRVGAVCLDACTRLAASLVRIAWLPLWGGEVSLAGDARRRFEHWLESLSLPTRPLRVGVCMPDEEAEALVAAAGPSRVEWFRLASWEDPQSACRRHLFDAAVFHDGEGPVRIVTLERPGHPAGVVEWADLVGELTFAKLFPSRVDPAAVVIEGATRTRVREGADLLRALVESAATLARCERRIALADRVLGRRATDMVERPAGLALWRSPRSVAAGVIAHLVRTAGEHAKTWPQAASIAADAGSAFLIAARDLNPTERHAGLLSATTSAAAGATAALRLGAACIGALEDDEGMDWLVRADKMLRDGSTPLAKLDHAAFLESELAHGSGDPMSVGRAAAGICLVCAATEPQRVSFLRDDMLEEMAYARWLVGRDQDRGLLIRVFLEIEHAHEPATRKKPSRKARRTATQAQPKGTKPEASQAA